jgi:hypothetical protein
MSITDAKRDLLDGWLAQAWCYRELDQSDLVDLTYDLRSALAGEPVNAPVLQFKSRRVK